MGTYSYAVSRFVPNPIRNEAVNIGVIVVDTETGKTARRFRRDLRGLKARCPGADTESLESMVKSLQVEDMPGGADDLESLARGHTNLLQFTPPRAVVAPSLEDSLQRAFETYIDENVAQVKRSGQKNPRALLLKAIDDTLSDCDIVAGVVARRPTFAGRRGRFVPDRSVSGSDGWASALHAISFEAKAKKGIESVLNNAKALVVDFDDAKARNGGLECTVVVEPPQDGARRGVEAYEQARGHLEDWHCTPIRLSAMNSWARKIGMRLGLFDRTGRPVLRTQESSVR